MTVICSPASGMGIICMIAMLQQNNTIQRNEYNTELQTM